MILQPLRIERQVTGEDPGAEFAIEFFERSLLPQERLQAAQLFGIRVRRDLEFALHDVQRIGRHTRVKGRMAGQLRHGMIADEVGDSANEIGRCGLILHGCFLSFAAPEGAASRFRFRKSGGRSWRAPRKGRGRS